MKKTTEFTRPLTVGCLILLSSALVNVCTAQFTATPTLWYEGDDLTAAAGAPASSWTANVGPTVSASAGAEPTVQTGDLGSHKYLEFGTGDFLQGVTSGSVVDATHGSLFIVLRTDAQSTVSGQTAFSWQDANYNQRFSLVTEWSPNRNIDFHFGNPGQANGTATASQPAAEEFYGSWHVLSLIRNGTEPTIRLDGEPLATSGTFNQSLNVTDRLLFIGGTDGSDTLKGAIAEIVTFEGAVDPGEVEQYLGTKYGLAPVPEPSEYAMVFGVACVLGALVVRRRQKAAAAAAV